MEARWAGSKELPRWSSRASESMGRTSRPGTDHLRILCLAKMARPSYPASLSLLRQAAPSRRDLSRDSCLQLRQTL